MREAPAELWLQLEPKYSPEGIEIGVEGWCLADVPVGSVQIVIGTLRRRLPVWLPRSDIEMRINPNGVHPALLGLCSGVRGVIRLPPLPPAETSIDVSLQLICTGGDVLEAGSVVLQTEETTKTTVHFAVQP